MRPAPTPMTAASPRRWTRGLTALLIAMTSTLAPAQPNAPPAADPYAWLEDVDGEPALAWVRERNAAARQRLQAWPQFAATRTAIREILDARERIPAVSRRGDHLYNLWQDADHPRGLWRRTTQAEYRKSRPAWETLIDLDALGKAEGVSWTWGGAQCLGANSPRCLVGLSRGGADAVVVREFDLATKAFVPGGFTLPEAKSEVTWIDADTVYVGTDFGPGSLTDSGYPRVIKRWKRGQALAQAATAFEVAAGDVAAGVSVDRTPGHRRTVFARMIDFYRQEAFLRVGARLVPVPKPADAKLVFWYDQVLVELRSDWRQGGRTWPRGSLLAADATRFMAGKGRLSALFVPTPTRSLAGFDTTRHTVVVNLLDNVASRLQEQRRDPKTGAWRARDVAAPFPGTLSVASWHDPLLKNDPLAEVYAVGYEDFLHPDTLSLATAGHDGMDRLKARPSFFDADGMRVEQRFASSRDCTRVPYFVIWPKGAAADGSNPTLLYGYGGFEVSMQPWYSGSWGQAWLGRGGVLVVANVRGGGEYGPAWHQAAVKANKQKSFDDFAAVAEDLVRQRITQPRQLGIMGGSGGGLLVGAVMLQRPELFGAVVAQVPLLDMKRYHQLLAGASWMAEYGDPDKAEDWAAISRYSPYQNVKPGTTLPPVLFITSTRDDRVHPGHARKMAARMIEQGHDVVYFENVEGGHGAAADNAQRADMTALEFAFLWQQLGRRATVPVRPSREVSK
jgi:prolyl oligopeptidase